MRFDGYDAQMKRTKRAGVRAEANQDGSTTVLRFNFNQGMFSQKDTSGNASIILARPELPRDPASAVSSRQHGVWV